MLAGTAEPGLCAELQPRAVRRPVRHETQDMPLCWPRPSWADRRSASCGPVWIRQVPQPFVVREVHAHMPELASSTVMTTLRRLADKGLLVANATVGKRTDGYPSAGTRRRAWPPPAAGRPSRCWTATAMRLGRLRGPPGRPDP
jgi:Penicillinase repressor